MKYRRTLLFLSVSFIFTGCVLTSGFQTYDLPVQGYYKTDQGAEIAVVQLTQQNIPTIPLTTQDNAAQITALFHQRQNIYTLSPGDVLSIQLWAYPEITPSTPDIANAKASGYPIDSNGNIQLPLIGQLHVAGKTLAEINRYIRMQFSRYLKHPDVVVRVISYEGRRYFVNGQVMKSGQYTLNDQPISIYTALGMAGGVDSKTGDNTNIQLMRDGQTYHLNAISLEQQGLSLHNLLIQPNDTLFINIRQDKKLYVIGESNRSQALALRDQGTSLSDVLGESEGINPYTASAARIFIMRTDLNTKSSTLYHLNLSNLGNLALANQFQMQKNDIVYVDATGLTRWQRIISQIMPFSSAIYSFNQLGRQ